MASITIPDKSTTDTLTASEFNQLLSALKDGTISITTEGVTVADDGYIQNEDAYISGGTTGLMALSTHAYYSNASWVFPDATAGSVIILGSDAASSQDLVYYTHDGAGSFTERLRYDVSETQLEVTGKLKVTGLFNLGKTQSVIASGVATVTSSYVEIDTEAAAATDDLDTINGGSDGDILIMKILTNSRVVTIKAGTGNIILAGAVDFVMNNVKDKIMLMYTDSLSSWHEISRSNNS